MKLQKRVNRTVGDKTYHKWVLTVPSEFIAALGWSEGADLSVEAKNNSLVVKQASVRTKKRL